MEDSKDNRVTLKITDEDYDWLKLYATRFNREAGLRKGSMDAALYAMFTEFRRRIQSPAQDPQTASTAETSGNDPLAGLSTKNVRLVRRLIDALRSGFSAGDMLNDFLDSHERSRSQLTEPHEEETPVKGKKHRKAG